MGGVPVSLTVDEIDSINEARKILYRIQRECMKVENSKLDGLDNYSLGRFVEGAERAEENLFQFLNIGKSYLAWELEETDLFLDRATLNEQYDAERT